MLNSIRFQSLKMRAWLALAVLVTVFLAFAAVMQFLQQKVKDGRKGSSEEWSEVSFALNLYSAERSLQMLVYKAVMRDITPSEDDFTSAEARFEEILEKLRLYQEDQTESLAEYQTHEAATIENIAASYQDLLALLRSLEKSPGLARYYYTDLFPRFEVLESKIAEFLKTTKAEMQDSLDRIKTARKRFDDTLIISSITLLALVIVLFVLFEIHILRPITRLHRGVERISQRQFAERIEVHRKDELGDLARSFNDMARKLAEYSSHLEGELERVERLAGIGRLSAGLAHEINNPLASILACSEGILRRWEHAENGQHSPDAEDLEYLKLIRDEVNRCKSITETLLKLTRKSPIRLEDVDLAALTHDAIQLVSHQIEGQPIAIRFSPPKERLLIRADATQLRQVLLNLLLNAIDAIQGEGAIDLMLSAQDRCAILRVTDTGIGFEEDQMTHLFEPFFTTKEPGSGTGLGLALSYSIVRAHGGALTAASEGPARGATFTMRLPLGAAPPADAKLSEVAAHV